VVWARNWVRRLKGAEVAAFFGGLGTDHDVVASAAIPRIKSHLCACFDLSSVWRIL
jgi:hypothetical protein